MPKIKGFLSVFFVVCVLTGCVRVGEKKPIRISINVWPGYAHAFIAQEKGFFKKNNVDVELVLRLNILESAQLYKDGEVDGFFDVLTDVVMINSEGIPTKIVYVADFSYSSDVIIGRPEIHSLSDLKGRTVSFEGVNSFSHLFVLKALEKSGLKETDVRFENILSMNVLDALEKGKTDAGHTWEPVTTRALKKGYKVLIKAEDVPGVITDVLAFHAKVLRERPDDVQRIVKSLIEARDFVYSNRVEAIEIMAEAEGITKEEMESGVNGVHQPDLDENIRAMKESGAKTSFQHSLDIITDFYITRGQLSKQPKIDEVLEPKFVECVRTMQTSQPQKLQ